jgi:two-component system, LuxR family, sensor kinase FixL
MNWVQLVWVIMAASSLTLGAIHLLIWFKQRAELSHLLFFVLATSAAAFGAFELALMQEQTGAGYVATLRWAHVPLAVFILSTVAFVRTYFGAGRPWLAWMVAGLRLLALVLNFLLTVNINFRALPAIKHVLVWGGVVVSGPAGIPNPWVIVPQISNLLLVVFVVDAAVTVWRRGGPDAHRRAALVGGSLTICFVTAGALGALITTGLVHVPTTVMPGAFLVVLAMGYELGWDVVVAAQLAARLRTSEARFRAVVETVPSAILLVDSKGTITLANAQATAVFGYPRTELIGSPVDMLIPEPLRGPHAGLREAYMADAQPRAMGIGRELVARRKDGTRIPVEAALSPMPTDTGGFVLVSVIDVTERRNVEAAVARQRNELAHLSRVATLGELSGSLAHELNQPLTAILSNAQAAQRFLAKHPPRLDKLSEILADIVSSNRRASGVIQRLRVLLRKEDAQHGPLDVNEVVEEALRVMRSDLLSRQISVETRLATGLPAVNGDQSQLQQVLLNVVINGCDAMDRQSGDRQLTITTHNTAYGTVRVTVADRGHGIPTVDLGRIFEPFMTTKSHGMGLGLAICRSIVEAHGGKLWATNNPAQGATLHCELPAARNLAG